MISRSSSRQDGRPAWVRWARLIALAAGVALLSYAGFTLLGAYLYQAREGRVFEQSLREHGAIAGRSELNSESRDRTATTLHAAEPAEGQPVARLEIPRIGLSALVLEGDDARTLRLGAGHIPGTSMPGEPGNIGIAGHRDTFFRRLRNIRNDDTITVRTPAQSYNYRVEKLSVVTPDQIGVLGASAENVLTLVTCYPFHYVGAAPERFIVRARQIEVSGHSARANSKTKTG